MATSDSTTKVCTKCGQEFPETAEYFQPQKGCKSDLRPDCRLCQKAYQRKYYLRNQEKLKELTRQWGRDNPERRKVNRKAKYWQNAELNREKAMQWYRENHERAKERNRQYRIDNHEELLEKEKRWREENPHIMGEWRENNKDHIKRYEYQYRNKNRRRILAWNAQRRARKRSAKGSYSIDDVQFLHNIQKGCCAYCGQRLGANFHVDHFIPLIKGGINQLGNLVLTCPHCNLSKGTSFPKRWIVKKFGKRRAAAITERVELILEQRRGE